MNAMLPANAATFRVDFSRHGFWEIREQGVGRALGAFAEEDDACAFADGLARSCEGARVLVNGRASAR